MALTLIWLHARKNRLVDRNLNHTQNILLDKALTLFNSIAVSNGDSQRVANFFIYTIMC